jgi:hypothetical protein
MKADFSWDQTVGEYLGIYNLKNDYCDSSV